MKKLLLLGSVVSPCPPKKHGGTERVAYYQAKHLAKRGMAMIFAAAKGTEENFVEQLDLEKEKEKEKILSNIEFVEIGGGTQLGTASDSIKSDRSQEEASRKLRLEMANLAQVQELMIERKEEYEVILNNMRGEAILLPLAKLLGKKFINVTHLNIFPELAELFRKYQAQIITISNSQRAIFPNLNYLATIYNPVSTEAFIFNPNPKNYALMISTIGYHKNQKEAIIGCQRAKIPLVLTGKIRDQDYFEKEIKPFVDGKSVTYYPECEFEEKLRLYQEAKVFLFPILWQEPFGLVCIEALSCGTPVIAYPNGGPEEIVKDGVNGFLVNSKQIPNSKFQIPNSGVEGLAEGIGRIKQMSNEEMRLMRQKCRRDAEQRFAEEVIGEQYYQVLAAQFQG